jgi:signal transduction histidine kinase
MSILRRDLLALGLALGAAIAGLVVWDYGKVDMGMTLYASDDRVFVEDVTPDGNAARNAFYPGVTLIDLTTVDGAEVERGEPLGVNLDGTTIPDEMMPWEYLGPIGAELQTFDRDFRWPVEAVEPSRIATAVAGDVDTEAQWINAFASIDRGYLEFLLQQSIWLAALGAGLGVAVWRLLVHGVAGAAGREHAILLGAAVATPFLLLPVVQVGTTIGMFAGYLVPGALALMLGLSLARSHPDRAWAQTGVAGVVVATGLATIFVIRYMTSPALAPNDRGAVLVIIAAIAVVPALISTSTLPGTLRDRGAQLSLALIPGAALTMIGTDGRDPVLPLLLLTGLLGWQVLPDRGFGVIGEAWERVRPSGPRVADAQPDTVAWRDRLTLGLLGLITVFGIGQPYSWAVIIGVALAALVGFGLRRGFLGPSWTDAAIPLAAAVAIPVVLLAFGGWDFSGGMGWASVPAALGSLSVAHLLASRHSDPEWRRRLFLGSGGLVVLIVPLGASNLSAAIILAALVPLIPGLPAAFAEAPGETRALTSRLETLVVTLTPGAAATVLFPSTNGFLLGAWLVAVVIWRQFTLNPLLGLAQRTEMQRDVAVAAAETERARLAADLHDDALQQLTMLVRKLDEGGQTDAAEEAREIATKLRSVVGDLRLPILDDLGAGAALEWLVERVEPLAGGSIKLERSDERRPPANVELAVFRVAQEALTNAIKHGKAPIAVRYDVNTQGRVTLAIDDSGDGIGSDAARDAPHQGHFGLLNMQQRAEQIGALLDVRRWPAGGTRVALEWRPQ